MKRADKCVHYTGTANGDTCDAGVKYDDVIDRTVKPHALPCIDRMNTGMVAKCDCRKQPTAEELAAEEAWLKKRFEDIGKARAAIVAHLGGPWKKGKPGEGGTIDCPACGQPAALRFTRSGYNGHIHAGCKTDGCVSWME